MKLGIMQPYFVPYLGYWQLINLVDKYVIYDDVNFIKGGWINRNRILINGIPTYFNIPMIGASSNKLINQIAVNNDPVLMRKSLKTIEEAYSRAPYYSEIYPVIEEIIVHRSDNLAEALAYSIRKLCNYLSIDTDIIMSSNIDKDNNLRGEAKVIELCKIIGANEYYNSIGGKTLYSYENFKNSEIKLGFIQMEDITYQQFNNEFQKDLSIIDVLMFNSLDEIKNMLNRYKLIFD